MNDALRMRLNSIYEVITADNFLASRGIGNEIGFYVFDYPPSGEMAVRQFVQQLAVKIRSGRQGIRLASVNLFEFLIDYLRERGFLEQCFRLQQQRDDAALLKALKGPLKPEKVAKRLAAIAGPDHHDLVLLHGVGSVYPLLRTHSLLTNLHPYMDSVPVVLFYPGTYVAGTLRLFGGTDQVSDEHIYYRALRLID